ncbi:TIR domain-containing protein [Amycolatopsis sp. NPDC051758]|uniref:TIR domain-containing protein n=1 Tax=Amycolatopsis sp. NPDC051758 TaxID=3363935 RepID=UPI00379CF117
MTAIFVNYRTDDGEFAAEKLVGLLAKRIGVDNVFFASRSIKPGEDFAVVIDRALSRCEILLAVIGPHWLDEKNGRRPIDDPANWVRIEIREAFDREVSVIPILLGNIKMPREADLPADIARLARCQYRRLDPRAQPKHFEFLADELVGLLPDISRYRTGPPDDRTAPRSPGPLDTLAGQLADAVSAQWIREEESRALHDPAPLQVRWTNAGEPLIDHWANILKSPAGTDPAPLDLAGELDTITGTYHRIPSGRLFVLGGGGSGKTVLAIRFTLSLLGSRTITDPVPVIFNLETWHPATTAFRGWLASRLAEDYPALAARGPNGSTLAADLVDGERILPVLDGFDEIAGGLYPLAMKALNATGLPLLLTSRTEEYESAVANVDVLTGAAGIELAPLAVTDLAEYLPSTTHRRSMVDGRPGPLWAPVLSRLSEQPPTHAATNLAEALSTPLMVGLARAIYSDTPGHDPAELLDHDRFGTTAAIEQHLLQGFLPALYEKTGTRGFDAAHAERWLGFLADHLQRTESRDLAWWRICSAIPRRTRAIVIGAAVATTVILLLALVLGIYWLVESGGTLESVFPPVRSLFGLLCGLSAAVGVGVGFTWRAVTLLFLTCAAAISIVFLAPQEPLNGAIAGSIPTALLFILLCRLATGEELAPTRMRFTLHGQSAKYRTALLFIVVGSLLGLLCASYFDAALQWHTSTFKAMDATSVVVVTIGFGLVALLNCAFFGFRPRYRLNCAIIGAVAAPAALFCFLVLAHGPSSAFSDLISTGPPAAAIGFAGSLPATRTAATTDREPHSSLLRTRVVRYMAIGAVAGTALRSLSIAFPALVPKALLASEADFSSAEKIFAGGGIGAMFGIVIAVIVGLLKIMEKFETEFDITVVLDPVFLLAADRRNALARSALYALTLGAAAGLIQLTTATGDEPPFMIGAILAIPFATVVLLAGKAWGRWLVLTRIWLPLTGRLPWRLVTFLEDAHGRGILRQVGAVYQFRHARLQEQLAATYRLAAEPGSPAPENVVAIRTR